jgi:hypothetical protein
MRQTLLATLVILTPNLLPAALVVVEHPGSDGLDHALEAGIPVVAEFERHLLSVGDADQVKAMAEARGLRVAFVDPGSGPWATVWLNDPRAIDPPEACGTVLWREGQHLVTSVPTTGLTKECAESPEVFVRILPEKTLRRAQPPASPYASGTLRSPVRLTPLPMVEEVTAALNDTVTMGWWEDVVGAASTRYSESAGCQTASDWAAAEFAAMGLTVTQPHHTTGMAPNVVAELTGTTRPDDIVILIGHLDDLPSSGDAPGADDNASGSAMVLAAAEAMSCYTFEATLRFILVTGEEQGLYGSSDAADAMVAAGETAVAVLNGDMIGWEGDGAPAVEDLDVNYNAASEWLASLFVEVAADYATGLAVNAFSCASMTYSDHAPFWAEGWSALCGITDNHGFCGQSGTYPEYHKVTDTIANCGPGAAAFFGAATRTYAATAAHLAVPMQRLADAPSGLSATPAGANRVDLAWTPAGPGLTHEVRRTPGGCSSPWPSTVVATTTAASAIDSDASGGLTYGYDVRAWDQSGICVSEPTTCSEAQTSGPCLEAPEFAGLASAADQGTETCAVQLTWPAAGAIWCGGPADYRIHRSTDPDFVPSPATLIHTTAGTSWTDTLGLPGHQAHTWVVRAVDRTNGAEDDNLLRLTARATGPVTLGTWSDDGGDSGAPGTIASSPWQQVAGEGIGGSSAWATGFYASSLCSALSTPALTLGAGAELRFSTRHDIEDSWDKGEVQLSNDGGQNWERLEMDYPLTCTHTYDACGWPTGDYFSGESSTWTEYQVDLSQWNGQSIMIRWVLSSDTSANGAGWWLDDISVTQAGVPGPCVPGSTGLLFADGFEDGGMSLWSIAAR